MRFFLALFATLCLLDQAAWSDENEKVKVGELLCNTTLERMIYNDGSGSEHFRNDNQPIRSAKITIYDIKKFPKLLFVEFHSPYLDETKKFMGISDLEKETFQIKFNALYTKSDYTGHDFTAVMTDYLKMEKKGDAVSIVRQSANVISYLFLKCQEL